MLVIITRRVPATMFSTITVQHNHQITNLEKIAIFKDRYSSMRTTRVNYHVGVINVTTFSASFLSFSLVELIIQYCIYRSTLICLFFLSFVDKYTKRVSISRMPGLYPVTTTQATPILPFLCRLNKPKDNKIQFCRDISSTTSCILERSCLIRTAIY